MSKSIHPQHDLGDITIVDMQIAILTMG